VNFDRLAPHYDRLETLLAGPRLQHCRTAWLDTVADARQALVAGCGHGRGLEPLLRRSPSVRVTALDASAGMLAVARHRLPEPLAARVQFVHAELPDWPAPRGRFELIVTDFFLDCFPPGPLEAVVRHLAAAAAPAARWLVADFALPSRGLARLRARAVHALMYACFRRVTGLPARRLTEPDAFLRSAGFARTGRRESEWGLLRSDCWRRTA